MLRTKQIFLLKDCIGSKMAVTTVLRNVEGFKGIECFEIVTKNQVNETFSKNKSIVCREVAFDIQYEVIEINISMIGIKKNYDINSNVIYLDQDVKKQFEEIASKMGVDIGDYKEVEKITEKLSEKSQCFFCELVETGLTKNDRECLMFTPNFNVIVTLGAFVPGYLIIIPKEHVYSMAALSKEQLKELNSLTLTLREMLKSIYGKEVFIWENGSGIDVKGKPSTSIVHAHLHLCPVNSNVMQVLNLAELELKEINLTELFEYSKNPYLFIWDNDDKKYILPSNEIYIPRQYIRQIIAEGYELSDDKWNWRIHPCWEEMSKTYEDIARYISEIDTEEFIYNIIFKNS